MKIKHLKQVESNKTRAEVNSLLDEARDMNYDPVLIIGIKDNEVYSCHSCKSKLQLLGALDLVSHDFKDFNF